MKQIIIYDIKKTNFSLETTKYKQQVQKDVHDTIEYIPLPYKTLRCNVILSSHKIAIEPFIELAVVFYTLYIMCY